MPRLPPARWCACTYTYARVCCRVEAEGGACKQRWYDLQLTSHGTGTVNPVCYCHSFSRLLVSFRPCTNPSFTLHTIVFQPTYFTVQCRESEIRDRQLQRKRKVNRETVGESKAAGILGSLSNENH